MKNRYLFYKISVRTHNIEIIGMENRSKSQLKKVTIKRKVHPNDADKLDRKNDTSKIQFNDLDREKDNKVITRVFYHSSIRQNLPKPSKPPATKPYPNLPSLKPVTVAPVRAATPKLPDLKPVIVAPIQTMTKPTVASELMFSDEFVPITSESIKHVLIDIEQIAWNSRLVLVVFDECFMKPDLTFNLIKRLYEPIVGQLDFNCFFLKTNLGQLMPNIAEAYAREFEAMNQAYIICSKELSEEEVVRRACERRILFGIMTSSCIVNSLKRETFLIKKEVLLDKGAVNPTTEIRQQSFDKGKRLKLCNDMVSQAMDLLRF